MTEGMTLKVRSCLACERLSVPAVLIIVGMDEIPSEIH